MSDELFREVDEEVRQDRFQELWKKYGTYTVAAVVVIVGATIAFVVWQNIRESARIDDSERFLAAVVQEQSAPEAALAQLRELARDGTPAYRFLASLREATLLADSGDVEQAITVFDAAAANDDISDTYRDIAKILAVARGMEIMSGEDVEQRLGPMNTTEHPFRFTAREFLALAAIKGGDNDMAVDLLRANVEDRETPLSTRARAGELLALIGN